MFLFYFKISITEAKLDLKKNYKHMFNGCKISCGIIVITKVPENTYLFLIISHTPCDKAVYSINLLQYIYLNIKFY